MTTTTTTEGPATLHDMPAHEALIHLAERAAEELGTGEWQEDPEGYAGQLEHRVGVTTCGVFGPAGGVTTMDDRGVTVLLDDGRPPLLQLRALIDQLEAHCIARGSVRAHRDAR